MTQILNSKSPSFISNVLPQTKFGLKGVARRLGLVSLQTVAVMTMASSVQAASVAPVGAENGMVVTAQHLATHVGVDVLKAGGNAIDAAVAVGYALAVVYPAAGNLGGGGFMTIQLADGRKTFFDFREKAPLGATANMYIGADGNVVPGLSTKGHLAVGVPGTVNGMELALMKYGTVKRSVLMAPAIKFAEEGFKLEQGDVDMLRVATEDFKKDNATSAIFLNNGQPFETWPPSKKKYWTNLLAHNKHDCYGMMSIIDRIAADTKR